MRRALALASRMIGSPSAGTSSIRMESLACWKNRSLASVAVFSASSARRRVVVSLKATTSPMTLAPSFIGAVEQSTRMRLPSFEQNTSSVNSLVSPVRSVSSRGQVAAGLGEPSGFA